ncbi:MAG: preprotein translocase subunit Sec61beta [Candidatus Aenigmarchaeota archaeon ex4484_14]|nr:MAG: preprotein translocase subunit Sec61beta [Candidatus Aenigmarchaeota archaeon ex4484_14]
MINMAKKKDYMPMSTAGLIRYFDEEEKGIKLTPLHVLAVGVLFIVLVKLLAFI